MMEWFSFRSQDTLFFRGAEPAVMGESHTASMIFPPPAHTIAGALRTAVLAQHGIDAKVYNAGRWPDDKKGVIAAIGASGTESPFAVVGPFFSAMGKLWVSCPYYWFVEKGTVKKEDSQTLPVIVARPLPNSLVVSPSGDKLYWANGKEVESLGGSWVPLEELCSSERHKTISRSSAFFTAEVHTGIALDGGNTRRKVRRGHLYSFIHARLQTEVSLVFGVTKSLPLAEKGILKLGAEQRFGEYTKISAFVLPQGKKGLYMALSILPGDEKSNRHNVATGKILYCGGWDMHRGFHKPMRGYFQAGSVFDEKINENFIAL